MMTNGTESNNYSFILFLLFYRKKKMKQQNPKTKATNRKDLKLNGATIYCGNKKPF